MEQRIMGRRADSAVHSTESISRLPGVVKVSTHWTPDPHDTFSFAPCTLPTTLRYDTRCYFNMLF